MHFGPSTFRHGVRCGLITLLLFAASSVGADDVDRTTVAGDVAPVPVVGHPCDGCEAAFDGAPKAPTSRLQLAPIDEPGERMVLTGRVLDRKGRGVEGVVLYLHQTDHTGRYPAGNPDYGDAARRHGRLRGWVRSDASGAFRIDTIRPGAYPGADIPQHIHMQVIEPGCGTYFIGDVNFADDPLLAAELARRDPADIEGSGIVTPRRDEGVWYVERNAVLGLGVPRYPSCGRG